MSEESSTNEQNEDYEVGYGKPPRHTQFQPGKSGNPNGRPKRTKDLQKLFERELDKTMKITEGGRVKTIPVAEVFVKSVMSAALKGDRDARKLLWGVMAQRTELEGFEVDTAGEKLLADLLGSLPVEGQVPDGQ